MAIPPAYTLIIAEKPRAAEKIVEAIAVAGSFRRIRIRGVPVWILFRCTIPALQTPIVVASAAGHLFSLHTDQRGYPVFSYRWVPRYIAEPNAKHTQRFLEVLKRLCRNALLYINACDYDIEGSLIGYLIIRFLGDEKRAKRAKFSSLTPSELRRAFSNLAPLDKNMAEAGECRHILDWLWGINVSRALMDAYERRFKKRIVLSAGRVQTPTLVHAVEIDLERKLFVPIPKLYPHVRVEIGNKVYTLEFDDQPFDSVEEAKKFVARAKALGHARVIDVIERIERVSPPPPFNLPDLQAEAARVLKLSPYATQKIAEDLYLDALISYPRTNSQRLPPTLDNKAIITKLCRYEPLAHLAKKLLYETRGVLKPHNGPKTDPAHPAIYPTGEIPPKSLPSKHRKLYELIVRRYLATFSTDAVLKFVCIKLEVANKKFRLSGVRIVRKGWFEYYPYSMPREKEVPEVRRGALLPIKSVRMVVRYTKPPSAITRLGLVKWMEENGIGTESTRAEIVETLYRRKYILRKGNKAEVSDLGIAVAMILRKYVPELTSTELTRHFEELINSIRFGRIRCLNVVEEAKRVLTQYLTSIKRNEDILAREFGLYIEDPYNDPKCVICNRIAYRGNLCIFHYEALKKIKENYRYWKMAGFEWHQYLAKLLRLSSTGKFVKEVIAYVSRNPSLSII